VAFAHANTNTKGDQPLYTVSDAARYLNIPASTLHSWVGGRTFPTSNGPRRSPPVINLPVPSGNFRLSFNNLIELYVLRSLRTKHRVSLRKIRQALDYAEGHLGIKRLLIHKELQTTGGDVFLEYFGDLIDLSRSGQVALKEILKGSLKRVTWEGDLPVRLSLIVPSREERMSVYVDPRTHYGNPTVQGVETRVLAKRVDAGEEPEELARDYGLDLDSVIDAIIFESALARAA